MRVRVEASGRSEVKWSDPEVNWELLASLLQHLTPIQTHTHHLNGIWRAENVLIMLLVVHCSAAPVSIRGCKSAPIIAAHPFSLLSLHQLLERKTPDLCHSREERRHAEGSCSFRCGKSQGAASVFEFRRFAKWSEKQLFHRTSPLKLQHVNFWVLMS